MAVAIDALALVPATGGPSLELAIAAWLDAKGKRSGSAKTLRAYGDTLASYREACQSVRLELDARDVRALALVAQGWAGAAKADGSPVTPATYNQRLAIVSSFYAFARKRGLLDIIDNPMALVDRRPVQGYAAAVPLDAATVAEHMAAIDRTTPTGLRDYALLAIGLETGRRLSELAAMRWRDIRISGGRITIDWPRAKGGKVMHDTLPPRVADVLLTWLHAAYGAQLGPSLAPDAPVWLSQARNASRGQALGIQSIADVCQKRLGVSKVHSLRHTFAHAMEQVGAPVSDIQARLGHASLQTTGRYLAQLRSAENAHGDDLAALFGIGAAPRKAKVTRPLARRKE